MDAVRTIVGSEHFTEHAGVLHVAPGTAEEVASVIRLCNAEGLVVSTTGGGTKLRWGNPVKAQVILGTRRLAGIREHVWQDMTATAGAGTTWEELEAALSRHGQRVALDTLFAANATLGGAIAVNDSGSLRLRYGSLRDLVLGMTIVLADGTIACSGGKVVKNVAGYDLPKLLTGSFGTLGVVTEVSFRLHPLQTHKQTWTITSDSATALAGLQQQLANAAMSIESMQIRLHDSGFALDVQFASLRAVLDEHEQRLRSLCAPSQPQVGDDAVWRTRESMFGISGASLLKITSLPGKVAPILEGFRTLAASGTAIVTAVADATGILTVGLTAPAVLTRTLVEDLRSRLRSDGGMVVVLFAAGDVDAALDLWGGSPPAIAVMREIKRQFDPQRTLNPGRFVGGI